MTGAPSHRGRVRWRLITGLFRASTASVSSQGSFLEGWAQDFKTCTLSDSSAAKNPTASWNALDQFCIFSSVFKPYSIQDIIIMPKEVAAHHAGLLAELGATRWFGSARVSILANAVLWPETWSPNIDLESMWRQPPMESPGITHLQTQHRLLKAPYS